MRPVPVLFGDVVLVGDNAGRFVDVTPAHDPAEVVYDVFFVDRLHGWVGFTDFDRAAGRLVRTADGGRTWEPTDLTARVHHSAGSRIWLYLLDATHGWAVASAAAGGAGIYRSTDGGRTWSDYKGLEELRGPIRFDTPSHGWLAAWSRPGGWGGLYESFDGGDTWHRRRFDPPEGEISDQGAFRLPSFYGVRGVLAASVSNNRVVFYVTSDGGRRWRTATSVTSDGADWAAIAIASERVWWLVGGDGGPVMVTEDAGATWTTRSRSGLPKVVDDFEAKDTRVAWATAFNTGEASTLDLYETTDGGETWRARGADPTTG